MIKENVVTVKNKVILNQIQDLQRLSLPLVNNLRGRSRIKYGMTALFNNNGGFTLIELLVVVLIIGILAAVALPQYQVAVAKARIKRNLPIWRSVLQASQAYYLANGKYTCDMDTLDVNSDYIEKAEKEGTSNVCDVRYKYTMKDGNSFSLNGYAIYADMGNVQITIYDNDTNRVCYASEDDDPVGEKVCKSLGTLRAGAKSNHNTNVYDF